MNSLYSRPLGSVKTSTLTFLCPLAQHPDTHFLGDMPPLAPASPLRLAQFGLGRAPTPAAPGSHPARRQLELTRCRQPCAWHLLVAWQPDPQAGRAKRRVGVWRWGASIPPPPRRQVHGRLEAPRWRPWASSVRRQLGSCEGASGRENKSERVYHLRISQ